MVSNEEKKKALMREHLAEKEQERTIIENLFTDDKMIISELDVVEPFVRKVILSWIGKAMATKKQTIKTDYGFTVQVQVHRDRMVILQAEDGVLKMPDVTLEMKGGLSVGRDTDG
nr:DUF2397 family protein [Bacillus salacetis]